jgi:ATP-dependent DNA helicase RecG
MIGLETLGQWLAATSETEHLEFKEARTQFDTEKLVSYCAALANECGGHLVLGVTNQRPRRVVGTKAFGNLEHTKMVLLDRLRLRIDVAELAHSDGRVLVFTAPSRPIGMPIGVGGTYLMRAGESLVAMPPNHLQSIFAEGVPDFSASICKSATIDDLSPEAIEKFRALWHARQPRRESQTPQQALEDAELLDDGAVTYAALVLVGKARSISRYLANVEIIFEYRADEGSIAYSQRENLRDAFLLIDDQLWRLINLRNTVYSLVDGLFRRDIPTFNERAVREAVLNAVCHRDYRLQGSIFIKQWPSRVEITSPGGFPPGITVENILSRQAPRNRRLAEAFGRCGLVERSGQGADLLFETAVREGKMPLDYRGSDDYQVRLTLHGHVQDEGFLRFLERVARDANRSLSIGELRVLDAIRHERPIPEEELEQVAGLIDLGVIERAGRRRLVLSRRYHQLIGRPGAHTRRVGLDRETNKALLMKHLRAQPGAPLADLCEVLPNLSTDQVRSLLRELKADGYTRSEGMTRAGKWYLSPKRPKPPT